MVDTFFTIMEGSQYDVLLIKQPMLSDNNIRSFGLLGLWSLFVHRGLVSVRIAIIMGKHPYYSESATPISACHCNVGEAMAWEVSMLPM